jgi:nitrile hydratase
MNGVHDLGGMAGFGPIRQEEDEPVFREPWERRVFGMFLALLPQGIANLDEVRHAIERMDPAHYLASSYYEHWFAALETLLVEKGIFIKEEIEAGKAKRAEGNTRIPLSPDEMLALVQRGGSTQRQAGRTIPCFSPGDHVVARNINPPGHTRIPRYVRGKRGIIERVHGTFIYPDTHAHDDGEQPQPVYCVRFSAREIWGSTVPERDSLYVDLWEDYLEPA